MKDLTELSMNGTGDISVDDLNDFNSLGTVDEPTWDGRNAPSSGDVNFVEDQLKHIYQILFSKKYGILGDSTTTSFILKDMESENAHVLFVRDHNRKKVCSIGAGFFSDVVDEEYRFFQCHFDLGKGRGGFRQFRSFRTMIYALCHYVLDREKLARHMIQSWGPEVAVVTELVHAFNTSIYDQELFRDRGD